MHNGHILLNEFHTLVLFSLIKRKAFETVILNSEKKQNKQFLILYFIAKKHRLNITQNTKYCTGISEEIGELAKYGYHGRTSFKDIIFKRLKLFRYFNLTLL